MMRLDLANANVDYEDTNKRVADFHALRHTFISNLARAGVHPRSAQALARHSTIDLTMNVYTHVNLRDLASGVESLPPMTGPGGAFSSEQVTCPPKSIHESPSLPDLAALAANWSALPEHVRQAIVTLAKV